MSFPEKNKKLLIILSSIVSFIIALMLIAQLIIGNILENKLDEALDKKENKKYKLDIGKVKVNLFTMTLIFKNVEITPDSLFLNELKVPTKHAKNAFSLKIPVVRIRNIGVYNYLVHKEISIDDFIINNAVYNVYKSVASKSTTSKPTPNATPKFKMDSIVIPGIDGVSINNITISSFSFNVINLQNNDTSFAAINLNLNYENIQLVKNNPDKPSLKLLSKNVDINMSGEKFNLPGGKYTLQFGSLNFNMDKASMILKDFKITPRYNLSTMAKMSKFQYEIYTCDIKSVEIQSIYPFKIIQTSNLFISKIIIDSMDLSIYKDKHFPFDTTKRPLIPTQSLKLLKTQLYVDSVIIKNSHLNYSELHDMTDVPMKVNLGSLNATVNNITSIKDSIYKNSIMKVVLRANLQNTIPMGVNIYFRLNSVADTFSFNGWLGNGNMKLFNKILLPAIGIKFDAGTLDGVKFTARANTTYAIGEMTMLYHDLDGVVVRKNMKETNKLLSWVANTAMIQNNPIPGRDKRVEPMYFNRVMYKGLGNFLWKTLQSGITATLIPTMDSRVQKQIDVTKGVDKKTIKKREREEKHKNKKKHKKK